MADLSIKQIAEMLNIDRQQVYRCIINNDIMSSSQDNKTKYYDEVALNKVKRLINEKKSHNKSNRNNINKQLFETMKSDNEFLKSQLQEANEQIKELHALMSQSHQLHAEDKIRIQLLEDKNNRKGFLKRLFSSKSDTLDRKE